MNIFGNVVEEDGVSPAVITISNDKITDFRRTPDALAMPGLQHSYDINRFLIFPGFVDIRTNMRGDYRLSGLAACNGGVTSVADACSSTIAKESHKARVAETQQCLIDVLNYACVGPDTSPIGDIPYHVFTGLNLDNLTFVDHAKLALTLNRYRGKSVTFHCEDPSLLSVYKGEKSHEHRRPSIVEYTAIDVILDFINDYQLDGYLPVSTTHGIDQIIKAKKTGVKVKAEVSPHHLFFDMSMITNENRRFLHTIPPLRSLSERLHLLDAVKNGDVDILATGHTPDTAQEKLRGAVGIPHLDTFGPFITWLIKFGIDPVTIWKIACKNPGDFINKFTGRKIGRIAVGYEASIVVVDMLRPPVDRRPLYSRARWSPFDLRTLPGSVQTLFLRGEKVIDDLFVKMQADS